MARQTTVKNYATFTKGIVTEAESLTFPENASIDELNCVPSIKGNRRRRLGIDYETGYSLSSPSFDISDLDTQVVTTHTWDAVGGNGNLNFLVTQIGDTLYFNALSSDSTSDGEKTFTVDLSTFLAAGQTNAGTVPIEADSGKGLLFVTSSKIDPFYIEYDSTADTIATSQITVSIRDFSGLDDGLAVDNNPTSLSTNHNYNLKNQGWNNPDGIATDLISQYQTSTTKYPANNQIWWIGKDADDNFDPELLSKQDFGNTPAPKGHFIIDAFYKDRSSVSGVGGIPVESETNRPQALAFFSGRVWYGGAQSSNTGSNLYFSQILFDSYSNVGDCYQTADPTSENDSILAESDGGVISIPRMGNVKKMYTLDKYIIIFADNGVWAVTGSDTGFTASSYQVIEVSRVNCISSTSVVSVEGVPVWWSNQGIYTLEVNSLSNQIKAISLSESNIQTLYDEDITNTAKLNVQGQYDRASKRIVWLYKEDDTGTNLRKYDRALILDVRLNAYYPWKFSSTGSNSPYVAGVFNTTELNIISTTETVTDGGVTVTDSGDTVTDETITIGGTTSFIRFLTIVPNGASSKYTFSDINNRAFVDWETSDGTGADFDSFIITGYELSGDIMRRKQVVYINTFLQRTEDLWELTGDGDYVLRNPSSCLMQFRWEWADSAASNKWSATQQVYRFRRNLVPDSADLDFDNGFPVVVTKTKVRGHGRAMSIKFSSESGKDFNILGWANMMAGETRP